MSVAAAARAFDNPLGVPPRSFERLSLDRQNSINRNVFGSTRNQFSTVVNVVEDYCKGGILNMYLAMTDDSLTTVDINAIKQERLRLADTLVIDLLKAIGGVVVSEKQLPPTMPSDEDMTMRMGDSRMGIQITVPIFDSAIKRLVNKLAETISMGMRSLSGVTGGRVSDDFQCLKILLMHSRVNWNLMFLWKV